MRNIIQWLESGDERAIRHKADSWPIGFSLWSKNLELDFLNEVLMTVLLTTGHSVPRTYEAFHRAIPVFRQDGRRVKFRERAVVVARREGRYVESKENEILRPDGERAECTIAAAPVYRHGKVWRIAGSVWTKAPEGRMLDLAELYSLSALGR